MVTGYDRELNAHFYSAASLKCHAQDTWHDTTSCHIILTLGRPVVALTRKSKEASIIFNDFGMSQPKIEPLTRNGHCTAALFQNHLLHYLFWYNSQSMPKYE